MTTHEEQCLDWRDDLMHSRDVSQQKAEAYVFFIGWYDQWRLKKSLAPGRESAICFWKECVLLQQREPWQLSQWSEAMRWYLDWLRVAQQMSGTISSLPERLTVAVHHVGSRRGLAITTKKSYASWVSRYGADVGDARKVMDVNHAKAWLADLVAHKNVSFSTQKQALNALVFFFRDVCGYAEVRAIAFEKPLYLQGILIDLKYSNIYQLAILLLFS